MDISFFFCAVWGLAPSAYYVAKVFNIGIWGALLMVVWFALKPAWDYRANIWIGLWLFLRTGSATYAKFLSVFVNCVCFPGIGATLFLIAGTLRFGRAFYSNATVLMLFVIGMWMIAFVVGWFLLYRRLNEREWGWLVSLAILPPMFWLADSILLGLLEEATSGGNPWSKGPSGQEIAIFAGSLGIALWLKARFARRCLDHVLNRWWTMLANREGEAP